mmetsp:Transcript_17431/g.54536  ORF Transcript_17431/g.54536 Transcript_17431/m.54536 type:complete len:417 (+) Transcript_17431:155-1405(+)
MPPPGQALCREQLRLSTAVLLLVLPPTALGRWPAAAPRAARGGGGVTRRAEAWRWQLLRTPDEAPEFRFAPRRRRGRRGPSVLTEGPAAEWRERDRRFEEEGLFCTGRWLGVQVLQAPEDLLHFQQLLVRLQPQVVLETGTYRGGLAFFAASVLAQLGLEHSLVVTMDAFDMESNFHNLDNHPLCPVCHECAKAHETELWKRHVVFFQGNSLHLAGAVGRFVREAQRPARGPVLVTLDAQHSYDATLLELHLYAGLASVGSYVVLQDARLDALYGRAGPLAAGARLLEDGRWLWDREAEESLGHTQHLWLRRLAEGPPVALGFQALSQDLVSWSPFRLLRRGARCAAPGGGDGRPPGEAAAAVDSLLSCQAVCLRAPPSACRFLSFLQRPEAHCLLAPACARLEPEPTGEVYQRLE